MSNITDRAAYLRGLADGMGLSKDTNEHKLLLEMLGLIDEMAHKLEELDGDIGELEEYIEDIDSDLAEVEDILMEDCDCCDDDCDCCHDEYDEDEELSFDCPNCGKTVLVNASAIDYDESPVCEHCGEPFFTDLPDEEEE